MKAKVNLLFPGEKGVSPFVGGVEMQFVFKGRDLFSQRIQHASGSAFLTELVQANRSLSLGRKKSEARAIISLRVSTKNDLGKGSLVLNFKPTRCAEQQLLSDPMGIKLNRC